jgi:hypothetical protein
MSVMSDSTTSEDARSTNSRIAALSSEMVGLTALVGNLSSAMQVLFQQLHTSFAGVNASVAAASRRADDAMAAAMAAAVAATSHVSAARGGHAAAREAEAVAAAAVGSVSPGHVASLVAAFSNGSANALPGVAPPPLRQ